MINTLAELEYEFVGLASSLSRFTDEPPTNFCKLLQFQASERTASNLMMLSSPFRAFLLFLTHMMAFIRTL